MPLPSTIGTYADCYEIWAAALDTEGGVRTLVSKSAAQAEHMRQRMYQARKLLREHSKKVYPKDHAAYNTSEYDAFKITLREDEDGDWWLYLELQGNWAAVHNIEPIPVDEREVQPPPRHNPQRQTQALPKPAPVAAEDELE